MFPKTNDSVAEQTKLLRQILAAVQEQEYGDVSIDESVGPIDESVTVEQGMEPGGMFTTGPTGIEIEAAGLSDSYEFELGFDAAMVNIRTDSPILVAFIDPSVNAGRYIPITADESPFTLGGNVPLGSDTVWVTQPAEDADPAEVHVIAM